MPGLARNLFSVTQAARNEVVSILGMTNQRLEPQNHILPPQELEHDRVSLSLYPAGGGNETELAIQATANKNIWHRRLGRLNLNRLNLLKTFDTAG